MTVKDIVDLFSQNMKFRLVDQNDNTLAAIMNRNIPIKYVSNEVHATQILWDEKIIKLITEKCA